MTKPGAVAIHLKAPQGELDAERRRLGMHAVGTAGHRSIAVLVRASFEHGDQSARSVDEKIGGGCERRAQCRVDHVGRREPVVDPLPGRAADVLLHDVDECGDVVISDCLARCDLGDECTVDNGCVCTGPICIDRRDDTQR